MSTPLIPSSLTARLGQVVYDSATDEEVTVSEASLARYQTARAKRYDGFLQIAEGLADIRDHRLYLVDGCDSFEKWISQMAGMSRQKVFNYLRIVDKYANSHGIVKLSEDMKQLGISKLVLATKLPKKEFERFTRTSELETEDGRRLDVDEISVMSVRVFEAEIRVKTGKQERGAGNQSPKQAEDRTRRGELHRFLQELEEGLMILEDEDDETWKAELHRIYTDEIKPRASHETDVVQTSAPDGGT